MKRCVVFAIAAVAVMVFVPTASAKWQKYNSVINLDSVYFDEATGVSSVGGHVMSPEKKCRVLRLVTVYRKQRGLDPVVGRTHSAHQGTRPLSLPTLRVESQCPGHVPWARIIRRA